MHANPYAITLPDDSPASAPGPASNLPLWLALTALLCCLLGLLINFGITWYTLESDHLRGYLDHIHLVAPFWLYALLLDAVSALLLSRYYLQRHGLARFARPAQVIGLYAGLYLAASLLVGLLHNQVLGQLLSWIYASDHVLSPALLMQPLNLLYFLLASLLPLWLSLHLTRRTARVDTQASVIARGELALAFALTFSVAYLKLLSLLPEKVIRPYDMEWLHAAGSGAGLLYGLVALLAAWHALPPLLNRLALGRLLASALLCLALWLVVAVGLGVLLVVILFSSADGASFWALLFGLLMLALIWPLTRLSLRWIYRPLAT
ncbi:hypothetical protein [Phytopseudomonas dryadis]|uniref:Uncharacterized protein n=1 Tax=Phytopseudomonas dryadis TaxID=2487520 RepID=A0A4Q9QVH2_9GAMM|nr:hypothetical protein [Pseudomonas dryadis]TBU85612.1 hypothetical protein DNK44_24120 [Pseudomonas dryadis]